MSADNEGKLPEHSYLIKSLSPAPDPSIFADTSWIQPGKAIRVTALTTSNAEKTCDFAVTHNIEWVEADAGWYGSETDQAANDNIVPISGFDPKAIGDYCAAKGKKFMLYVNYRGLDSYDQRGLLDDLFNQLVAWNVDGVKFGFVPQGDQADTKKVYGWVKTAAQSKLAVDIHDEMLPTGLERTYPNILSMEGIHGDETNPTPQQDLGYIFTRGVNGAADHTWVWGQPSRNTSKSFRYAGPIVYASPIQFLYWYDGPTVVNSTPELWDNLPTVWDESRFLEQRVNNYVTVARKHNNEWWIGSLTAVNRTATISLSFLHRRDACSRSETEFA